MTTPPRGLLASLHRSLAPLFEQFLAAGSDDDRRRLALRIGDQVAAQCAVDEELLYPEAARVVGACNRVNAAQMEGLYVRKVVDQIRDLATATVLDTRRFVATVEVLHDYLSDYVVQQHADVLSRLGRRSGTPGIYEAMRLRRDEILAAGATA